MRGDSIGRITLGVVLLAAFWRSLAAAQVDDADQICAPAVDPCVVTTAMAVSPGANLDFGSRTLRIAAGGSLNAGSGGMSITCGALRIESNGRILARGSATDSGGNVTVEADTTISIAGVIDVSGNAGGNLGLSAADRIDLQAGSLMADGQIGDSSGNGGEVTLTAAIVSVGAAISAVGGTDSSGGCVSLTSTSRIEITGAIDVSAGAGSGQISISSDGDVVQARNATLRADASDGGSAGTISIAAGDVLPGTAGGSLMLAGLISAVGGNDPVLGGTGGEVDLSAGRDCQIDVTISAASGRPQAMGGTVSICCGASPASVLAITGDIDVRGVGDQSAGGIITIDGGGAVSLSGSLLAKSGTDADAGSITVQSAGDLALDRAAVLRADANGANGAGGAITFDSGAQLTANGTISAIGGSDPQGGGAGGTIGFTAKGDCRVAATVTVASGAPDATGGTVSLDCGDEASDVTTVTGDIDAGGGGTRSDGGEITINASGPITLSGSLFAKGGVDADGGNIGINGDDSEQIIGVLRVDGGGAGSGGTIALDAAQALMVTGMLSAAGGADLMGGGDGGSITVDAYETCQLAAVIAAPSGLPGGVGGSVQARCGQSGTGNLVVSGTIDVHGQGSQSGAGSITLSTSGTLSVLQKLDAHGAMQGGGSVSINAGGAISVAAPVVVTGSGGHAGKVDVSSADASLTLEDAARITADAANAFDTAGDVSLQSCVTSISRKASISALGLDGSISILGVNRVEIDGTLSADALSGVIELASRDSLPLPQLDATLTPRPLIRLLSPQFPGCEALRPTPTATSTSTATPTGSATFTATRTATPTATGSSTPSSTATATNTPAPTATPTATVTATLRPTPLIGDANCDGELNSTDLLGVAPAIFDSDSGPACPLADVNSDGEPNAADYVALTVLLLGK